MKRVLLIMAVGAIALMMIACSDTQKQSSEMPTGENTSVNDPGISSGSVAIFRGIIEEINDEVAIITPNEDQEYILSSGDKVSVNLSVSENEFVVGDEVVVYYTGEIMESYPLQIVTTDVELASEFDSDINEENNSDIQAEELLPVAVEPEMIGKAAVNIEGIIIEVSEDGKSFLLDTGKWVRVTDDTEMGITGTTAAPIEEQYFEETFRVGNSIAGFTEDENADELIAYAIYTNWNWDDPIR